MILFHKMGLLLCTLGIVLPVQIGWAQETSEEIILAITQQMEQREATGADYVRLGNAYLDVNELDEAHDAFEKAVRLGEVVRGHTGIGLVLSEKKNRGIQAQYHFRRALGEDPTHAEAQYGLAKLYERLRPLDALDAFEKAIDMAPNHPDAYFQLGKMFERDGDRVRASVAYEQQIEVTPGHGEARYRLGKMLFAQGQHKAAAKIFSGLIATGGEVGVKAYLEMALMSEIAKNYDSAQRLFEKYIGYLSDFERATYKDIRLVADKKELALLEKTPQEEKEALIDRFWNSRDPAPLTRANERLVEHYRRVALALSQYAGRNGEPWDDRGNVYVRLGHPDHVSRYDEIRFEPDAHTMIIREEFAKRLVPGLIPSPGLPLFPVEGRWEYWVYTEIDRGVEFTFVSPFGNSYSFADVPLSQETSEISPLLDIHGEFLIQNIALKEPSRYRADFAELPIDFYYYPAGFKAETKQTRLELFLGLPATEVSRLRVDGEDDVVVLERGVALYDSLWHEKHRVTDRLTFRIPTDRQIEAGAFIPGVLPVTLEPGKYYMSLQVRDAQTGHSQVYQQTIELDDYRPNDVLLLSDIELAFVVVPTQADGQFVKNGLNVVPMSSKAFRRDQNAYIYFEIYNLERNDFGQTQYRVEYTMRTYREHGVPVRILRGLGRLLRLVEEDQQVVIAYEQVGDQSDDHAYVELDLTASDIGDQEIVVEVTDLLTEQKMQKKIRFKIVP